MKNKFIKSTMILIVGGFITKILGMIIKIIMTRNISEYGVSLYTLTLPTYNLFITIVTSGMQIATSKLVSENKYRKKDIIMTSIIITIIISIISVILILLFSKSISSILHNNDLYYPILSIILSLPFIGISSVIRGYFFGINKMHVHVISNFIEQLVRIVLYIIILPKMNNDISAVSFIIGSNILSELAALTTMTLFLPKTKIKFNLNKSIKKEILSTSIPSTTSRLIGTISYFFEPILVTNLLLLNGYDINYISYEYGIINGYVIQLLLLPSFFSMAISQSIIPLISKAYINKNYLYIKKKIKEIISLSFIIGLSYSLIILINPKFFLNLIYNTNKGINYIKIMAPLFILLYIQTPLTSILQSMNMSYESMKSTIYGFIIKLIFMIMFSYLKFGIYSYIIPLLINIVFVTIHNYVIIKRKINSFL